MYENRPLPPSGVQWPLLVGVGSLGVALAGVIVGMRMALHAVPATCPGTTHEVCHSHSNAGIGTFVALASVLLAEVVGVVVYGIELLRELHAAATNRAVTGPARATSPAS